MLHFIAEIVVDYIVIVTGMSTDKLAAMSHHHDSSLGMATKNFLF